MKVCHSTRLGIRTESSNKSVYLSMGSEVGSQAGRKGTCRMLNEVLEFQDCTSREKGQKDVPAFLCQLWIRKPKRRFFLVEAVVEGSPLAHLLTHAIYVIVGLWVAEMYLRRKINNAQYVKKVDLPCSAYI